MGKQPVSESETSISRRELLQRIGVDPDLGARLAAVGQRATRAGDLTPATAMCAEVKTLLAERDALQAERADRLSRIVSPDTSPPQTRDDIKGWILHPGGARLLGNIEEELGLDKKDTQPSWDVLGNVGNLSSATILFILQEWLDKRPLKPGDLAFAAAFGPGFSAEFLLLQWT